MCRRNASDGEFPQHGVEQNPRLVDARPGGYVAGTLDGASTYDAGAAWHHGTAIDRHGDCSQSTSESLRKSVRPVPPRASAQEFMKNQNRKRRDTSLQAALGRPCRSAKVVESVAEVAETVPPQDPARPKWFICSGAVLSVLFVWAWWPTLLELVQAWEREPDYSHGFFVGPLALFFLWLRRDRFPSGKIHPSCLGLLLIAASLVVRSLAGLWYMGGLDGWAILIWAAGAVCVLGGLRLLFWCLPSIAFLFFMVPLPHRIEHAMSYPLQQVAAKISGWLLQCLAQPALVEGNTILLGDQRLEVAAACSGLRIFIGILALACAYIIAVRRPWWEKVILLASAVPVALTANALRIVGTGLLYQHASASMAKSFSHDLAGWAMIPVAAALFAMILWYLGRLFREVEVSDVSRLVRGRCV